MMWCRREKKIARVHKSIISFHIVVKTSKREKRKRLSIGLVVWQYSASIWRGIDLIRTYRPLYGPSTFASLPSPETTATRSLPLNHFNECKFPHDFTSMGHSSATVWPRNFDIVLSEMKVKEKQQMSSHATLQKSSKKNLWKITNTLFHCTFCLLVIESVLFSRNKMSNKCENIWVTKCE